MADDAIAALTARLDHLEEVNRALTARCFAQSNVIETMLAIGFKLSPDLKDSLTKTLRSPMNPGRETLSFEAAEWWSDVEVKRLEATDALIARAEKLKSGLG